MKLSKTFRQILQSAGLLVACSHQRPEFVYEDKTGATVRCETGDNFLQEITPNTPIDFMELTKELSAGEACKTATKKNKCEQKLSRLRKEREEDWQVRRLLVTSGDRVWAIDKKKVRSFVEPVDSIEEAALVSYLYSPNVCFAEILSVENGFQINVPNVPQDSEGACVLLSETYFVSRDGNIVDPNPGGGVVCRGRRPQGLCEPALVHAQTLGAFFAEAAWQEAVSVPAFLSLARDLQLLGAPTSLCKRALRSVKEELRHARQMTHLAQRFGHPVHVPKVVATPPQSAFSLAMENMREGCINETFAALLACFQAEHAQDPEIKSVLQQIARDETRHASLSFDIQAWLLPKLSIQEKATVEEYKRQTIEALSFEELPEEAARSAGWPSAAQANALLEQTKQLLWS